MDFKHSLKEILTIILAAFIIGFAYSIFELSFFLSIFISFLIILTLNVVAKKFVAYHLDAKTKVKFWEWYQYWFRKDSHFRTPVPMFWLPLVISFISYGFFQWLALLEFDVEPRTERVSKRHGLYRFSEMTDWHIASIATFGIVINLILAVIGYMFNFELFARLNIYFAIWSLVPLSSLDGSKILFGSKGLWFTMVVISMIFLGYSLIAI
jgi:hypothetical protein